MGALSHRVCQNTVDADRSERYGQNCEHAEQPRLEAWLGGSRGDQVLHAVDRLQRLVLVHFAQDSAHCRRDAQRIGSRAHGEGHVA